MKQSGKYWKERFRQLEEAQNDISASKIREMQERFEKAQAAISGKINAWYQRFAANNGISMAEARRMLSTQELKEFQWNVEDYIKYGKENAVSQTWEKQLENASARVHISRLEALKLEVQQELEKMYENCLDSVDRHIKDIYASGFYHSAYEIQKGVGIGIVFQKLDPGVVEKIITKPWAVDGKNFSDRIWENKTKLINQVHNSLSVMCITGEAPDRAIREIAKNMNVSRSQAGRLVMTESAAFAGRASADCMKSLGVEEFEVVESLDHITCDYCQSMDGKHFPMGDFQIGVTAPPFHPNCRGCTCPYFNDEFTIGEERAARGEDGKVYYVPSDMTYEEWEKSFVKDDTFEVKEDAVRVHSIGKLDRNIYRCITDDIVTDELIITDERIKHIRDRHPNDYERFYSYISEIIQNPDYIIKANKPDTATILKEIGDNEEKFQLVLRIITSKDNPEFKNSVITFLKINKRTWDKYLRNKDILYKKV